MQGLIPTLSQEAIDTILATNPDALNSAYSTYKTQYAWRRDNMFVPHFANNDQGVSKNFATKLRFRFFNNATKDQYVLLTNDNCLEVSEIRLLLLDTNQE